MEATIAKASNAHVKLISAALQWLDVEQPDEAILSHHGINCARELLRCNVRLCPIGAKNLPVFVFDIAKPQYTRDHEIVNPFTVSEIGAILRILPSAGVYVVDYWNGKGCITASFSHGKPCGPSLRAALERYDRGCPTHPKEGVFCRCDWYKNGYKALRLPEGWN